MTSTPSPKPSRSPQVETTDIVFPSDTNTHGTMFGGKVLALMDKAAFLAAVEFAHVPFVTVSMDHVRFVTPIHVGEIIEARSRVAYVARTSLVARVDVFRRDPYEDKEPELACRGWFVLAARGRDKRPITLPELLLETDKDIEDAEFARRFRERSLAWRA
jgi:acyl-CoA hydrolase